jgi:signal transduction histidine kinase
MTGPRAAAPVLTRSIGRVDALLAIAVGIEMQIELLFVDATRGDLLIARAVLLALAGAVALRRRAPVAAAAIAVAAAGGLAHLDIDSLVAPFFLYLLVSYSVGTYTTGRELAAGAAVLFGGSAVAVRLGDPPGGVEDMFFAATILTGGPLLLGRLVRARVRLNEALHEKAAAAERDRAARAAGAVADERTRIAAELHHVVSDALASMVGEADAAERTARSDPGAAELALAAIERTGRDTLGQIRELLGVLRRDDEELALAPLPSLTHVGDLVARVRAAGLPVELEVLGTERPLPAGVDLTAYRVVQEALGGVLEAPDARRAAVRLRYGAQEVVLEVDDAGDTTPGAERRLLGIHERVALYGGELVAEPHGRAGYAVRARLPAEPVG